MSLSHRVKSQRSSSAHESFPHFPPPEIVSILGFSAAVTTYTTGANIIMIEDNIPLEIWTIILFKLIQTPTAPKFQDIQALLNARCVSKQFNQLIMCYCIPNLLNEMKATVDIFITSLDWKARFGSSGYGFGAHLTQNDLRTPSRQPNSGLTNGQVLPALSATLPKPNKTSEQDPSIRKSVGNDKISLACSGYDALNKVLVFDTPKAFSDDIARLDSRISHNTVEFRPINQPDSVREVRVGCWNLWDLISQKNDNPVSASKCPYFNRVYALNLKQPKGIHYLSESDMILEYGIEDHLRKQIKFVPKPGENQTMRIEVVECSYRFIAKRAFVTLGWLFAGLLKSSNPVGLYGNDDGRLNISQLDILPVVKSELLNYISCKNTNLRSINWRSELVSRYLVLCIDRNFLKTRNLPISRESFDIFLDIIVKYSGIPDSKYNLEMLLLSIKNHQLNGSSIESPIVEWLCDRFHNICPEFYWLDSRISSKLFVGSSTGYYSNTSPRRRNGISLRDLLDWENCKTHITNENLETPIDYLDMLIKWAENVEKEKIWHHFTI